MSLETVANIQERLLELRQIKRLLTEAPLHTSDIRISSVEFALLYLTDHMITIHKEALALMVQKTQT